MYAFARWLLIECVLLLGARDVLAQHTTAASAAVEVPGPLVPLQVSCTGPPQLVTAVRAGEPPELCTAPCSLLVPAGLVALTTHVEGQYDRTDFLAIPAGGLQLRLARGISKQRYQLMRGLGITLITLGVASTAALLLLTAHDSIKGQDHGGRAGRAAGYLCRHYGAHGCPCHHLGWQRLRPGRISWDHL